MDLAPRPLDKARYRNYCGYVMSGNSRFPVAVHVMAALAYRDGEALPSPLLAESVKTNPVVIRRLVAQLRRAGLVEARPASPEGSGWPAGPNR